MSHHGPRPSYLDELTDLGATGNFPRGKIQRDDEGEIKIAIAADPVNGVVRVEFGKPTAWIAFTGEQAKELADSLIEAAFKLRGIV